MSKITWKNLVVFNDFYTFLRPELQILLNESMLFPSNFGHLIDVWPFQVEWGLLNCPKCAKKLKIVIFGSFQGFLHILRPLSPIL